MSDVKYFAACSFPNLYTLVAHEVEQHTDQAGAGLPAHAQFDPVSCAECGAEMSRAAELASHPCSQTRYSPTRCTACR